jgi:cytochrome oxidase Cu insertion factor (SCO1/SenC/PrrC family)
LLAAFPDALAPRTSDRLYLVDPLGNLLMSYPPDAPPRALLDDLERLLKLSHIG